MSHKPIADALLPLACSSPEELEALLDSARSATGEAFQGTLESLTMTVMTSIE